MSLCLTGRGIDGSVTESGPAAEESKPKLFLTRYFSFSADGGEHMYNYDQFWGFPMNDTASKKVYSFMARIMGSESMQLNIYH